MKEVMLQYNEGGNVAI